MRVLIVDDEPLARRRLVQLLAARPDVEIAGEAESGREALELVELLRPDVLLLDIDLPGMNGIQLVTELAPRLPNTKIVMLTVSRNDEDLFDALRAGASGYLLKDLDAGRLCEAVARVLEGEAPLSASLVGRLIDEFRQRGRRRPLRIPGRKGVELTSKEWEVLDLLRGGHSTQEIADKLYVSPVTVRTHVSAILRKLRVPNREAAVELLERE